MSPMVEVEPEVIRGVKFTRMCGGRVPLRTLGWKPWGWARKVDGGIVFDVAGLGAFWGTHPVYTWSSDSDATGELWP